MRRRRTIYFNDARHYYLYAFEPPMKLEDAWRPIDEVAGTAVDTFIYGVSSGGLFYPSKIGAQWGGDQSPFAYAWRARKNMQSLIDRGLDPLTVLIDRAHEVGLDFFASLRMGSFSGSEPHYQIGVPGPMEGCLNFAHAEARDHQFAVLEELATEYSVEGIELDFGYPPFFFKPDEVEKHTPLMTEYVGKISEMVRNRPGEPGQVGARVFPTEKMCLEAGLDVRTWFEEGIVDFVVPFLYGYFILDPDMPIDWLIQSAHQNDSASVYAVLQPYSEAESVGSHLRKYATPEMMRAAAGNSWDRGADGLYTWFLRWPLGDAERRILTEIGNPELSKEGEKHYVLPRRCEATGIGLVYDAALPIEIPSADPNRRYEIPFYISDDIQGSSDRVREVRLKINVSNLVTADNLAILLNGRSLSKETCTRTYGGPHKIGESNVPYPGQWLELHLEGERPHKGENLLEVSLEKRPEGFKGGVIIEDVEIVVEYGPYASSLNYQPDS